MHEATSRIARLFGTRSEGSDEVAQNIHTTDEDERVSLFALVIGINDYQVPSKLKGAVPDADAFAAYLSDDLRVPKDQITNLRNGEATRVEIIKAFKALKTNPAINKDDPIVIFYAGHGSTIKAPIGWETDQKKIQALVPQDVGVKDASDKPIPPIPDRTIAALLNDLAESKGDNITVIFDCCHSASGTREEEDDPDRAPRVANLDNLLTLSATLDDDILGTDNRSSIIAKGFSHRDMRSHVLLAACGSDELSYETNARGDYTTALLSVLKASGASKLTYKGCMHRFPSLPKQNPHCEGYHVNRFFFNAKAAGASRKFISITQSEGKVTLKAGAAQGITLGSIFDVHADHVIRKSNQSLGQLRVSAIEPFSSTLLPLDDQSSFAVPTPAYGSQSGIGPGQEISIYFTDRFLESGARSSNEWQKAFKADETKVAFQLVESEDLAQLVVDVEGSGRGSRATFRTRHGLSNTHGITLLPHTTPNRAEDVLPVLRAAALWFWHVDRTSSEHPFNKRVQMRFFRVEESAEQNENGDHIRRAIEPDLNSTGVINILENPDEMYGIELVNNSSRDLYPYLFYFDASGLAIDEYYLGTTIGDAAADAPLPVGASLRIGYGSGGQPPFQYELAEGQKIDVGIIKLFLTTSPAEFESLVQESPFGGGRGRDEADLEMMKPLEMWDTITMVLVQRKP